MKMASQRFCLRWNNHQSNLLSVFDQLLHAETFTDVTLAVDGQYLKAHKMVLSACSPYFNALFVNHPEKHPIVILKDVPFSDMKSLLDFMYRGEVSVDQERLTAFLRVAESLRIKGLTEVNDDKPADTTPTPPPAPPQLQRIQPYLIQQQQQQHHQPQRNKAQSLLNTNASNNNNNNSNNTAQAQAQQQQQHSLLSSALASMPKRKRGRPRKLSGSSNGTGNEYDDYEREGVMNDLELGEGKMGNENFSGNEDISDDTRAESCDNDQDLNESRDSASQPKKAKQQKKDSRSQQSNDNNNSTSDPNDSDCDDQMEPSYMEPQLMLDEYDEPVEFKFDPNSSPSSQENNASANITQQARQQALLLAAQHKHQQQLVEAAAAAAAAAGGLKMAAVVGTGNLPGTVTLMNPMVGIPKLTPIIKSNKPKTNKRSKLKQNGVSGGAPAAASDVKPFNNDFIDIFAGNFMGGSAAQTQPKLKGALSGSTGTLNIPSPSSKMKLNTSCGAGDGEAEGSVRDYCTKEAQLINASPELSQRLFGSSAAAAALTALQKQKSHQQQTAKETAESGDAATHLPTALGLKMRVSTQLQQQQSSASSSSNSLLKQQLRSGLKDETINSSSSSNKPNISNDGHSKNGQTAFEEHRNGNEPCSGLQSLANAAERQAAVNAIQPPTASNLHHQFLIHMAANPMLNAGSDYFKQQQQQQQKEELLTPAAVECILEPLPDNRSEPELTLVDEAAGLGYNSPDPNPNSTANKIASPASATTGQNPAANKANTPRPVQRRRIRRKAQSSIDDQAEHLTEMSVRGLDLFRYASITEGVYQCTECAKENVQKTFKNKYSFQRHAFLYHEGKHRKVFPCPVCGKEFSRPDKMKNHMKMTHESFVSKQDLNTYHPLNYLISAAATGDLHSSLFPPSTQAQQAENEAALMRDEVAAVGGGGSDNVGVNLTQRQSGAAALPTPVDALLKLQQELVIKNEFISPSPSPPPTSSSLTRSQPHTQRLEEVK